MVYLIDDKYIFIGDTLWFGAEGGYSFISALAEDNKLEMCIRDSDGSYPIAGGIKPNSIK